jgi:hypothetical protein
VVDDQPDVFTPRPAEGFEWASPDSSDTYELLHAMAGVSQGPTWAPPGFHLVHEPGATRRSDMPWLGQHTLVVRESAREALEPVLGRDAEFLPTRCSVALWLVNCLTVLDALDEAKSDLDRFSSGRVMRIKRPVFDPLVIKGVAMFKVPQLVRGTVFVHAEVVAAYDAAGLAGVDWQLIT